MSRTQFHSVTQSIALNRTQSQSVAISRTHLRLVHVAPVSKELYERGDGACRGDNQPILCRSVGEHCEGLCGLHLRRGVPPLEEGHEGLHNCATVLLIRSSDVKDRPLSIPVKREV